MPGANDLIRGKDLPDFRKFVTANDLTHYIRDDQPDTIAANSVGALFTFNQQGVGEIVNFSVGGVTKIRINNAGQLISDLTTGTAPFVVGSTTLVSNLNADLLDGVQGSQFVRNDVANQQVITNFKITGTAPILTFEDTTTNDDDYTIGVDADILTITNTISGDKVEFGKNPLLTATPAGSSDVAIRSNMANANNGGIPAYQVLANSQLNVSIRSHGQISVAAGHPSTLSSVPSAHIVLGGQLDQNVSSVGNVGTGEDTLHSYTIPANCLANNGDTLQFFFSGTFAANANNKQLRLYFDGTPIVDTGAVAFNGLAWIIRGDVIRITSGAIITNIVLCVGLTGNGNSRFEAYAGQVGGIDFTSNITFHLTGSATNTDDIECTASAVRKYGQA